MKNIKQLRAALARVVSDLQNKKIDHHSAKEINNAAGKAIGSLKIQLDYARMRKEKPDIGFLGDGDED